MNITLFILGKKTFIETNIQLIFTNPKNIQKNPEPNINKKKLVFRRKNNSLLTLR